MLRELLTNITHLIRCCDMMHTLAYQNVATRKAANKEGEHNSPPRICKPSDVPLALYLFLLLLHPKRNTVSWAGRRHSTAKLKPTKQPAHAKSENGSTVRKEVKNRSHEGNFSCKEPTPAVSKQPLFSTCLLPRLDMLQIATLWATRVNILSSYGHKSHLSSLRR